MNILILGGTGFIGPHLVRHALDRGHTLTLFNRGRTNTHLFPNVEKLVGDRNGDVAALEGRRWDAVVDNSGYTPNAVRLTADVLRETPQYLFTSTRLVYRDFTGEDMNEDHPVGPVTPESEWRGYGPNKVLCERIVQETFPNGYTIPRPPIVCGPEARDDRFLYDVDRIDDGGEVMACGDPTDPVQYVDVRDLVEFYVHTLENRIVGIFNVEAPAGLFTASHLYYGIRAVTSAAVSFTWVDWDFLLEHDVRPVRNVPFWQPPRGRYVNYSLMNNSRAIAAGMRFRPFAVTAGDTLAWHRARPSEEQAPLRSGIERDKERQVLEAWHRR